MKESNQQQQQPRGRLICAWCGADLGASGTLETSHGICKACARSVFRQYVNKADDTAEMAELEARAADWRDEQRECRELSHGLG